MRMTRRQFLGTSVATVAVAACGGDDKTDAAISGRNCAANGTSVQISDNHGHTLNVTASDIAAGVDKTYDITGSADHTHTVTIRAQDFARLQSNPNGSVMAITTTTDAHQHDIIVLCAT